MASLSKDRTAGRRLAAFMMAGLAVTGCANRLNTLERPKGQIELRRPEGLKKIVGLRPSTDTQMKERIEVTVRYATVDELNKFFGSKEIFGAQAGKNPYPEETLIYFVKVRNTSAKKIQVNPEQFVMIDDVGIQFSELSPDNISALLESNANLWSFAKTTGDLAPGPYGAPLKVASAFGEGGSRKQHFLIKQARLAPGYIYPSVAYDGYVAFPRPHPNAKSVQLFVDNIKTDFNAADIAEHAVSFEFSFAIEQTIEPEPGRSSKKS